MSFSNLCIHLWLHNNVVMLINHWHCAHRVLSMDQFTFHSEIAPVEARIAGNRAVELNSRTCLQVAVNFPTLSTNVSIQKCQQREERKVNCWQRQLSISHHVACRLWTGNIPHIPSQQGHTVQKWVHARVCVCVCARVCEHVRERVKDFV